MINKKKGLNSHDSFYQNNGKQKKKMANLANGKSLLSYLYAQFFLFVYGVKS